MTFRTVLLYLYDVGGVGDDSEDVEGGPGHKEDNWDQRQEDVGLPSSVLLTDGCCWEDGDVHVLRGGLEGKVDPGIGHCYYETGHKELDKETEVGVHLPPERRGKALLDKGRMRLGMKDIGFHLEAIGSVLEEHLNFRIDEEREWEYDTEEQTN